MIESSPSRVVHNPMAYTTRMLRSFSSTPSLDHYRRRDAIGHHGRKPSATKPPSPCTVRIDGAKFTADLDWCDPLSEPSTPTDVGDAEICVALTGVEYNRATQRLTGSVKVRNFAATPVTVVIRYSIDGGDRIAEVDAQLLFGSGPCMDVDVYAFSLRTGRNILTQPGQELALMVVAYVDGVVVAADDNFGKWYKCRAEPRSAFLED